MTYNSNSRASTYFNGCTIMLDIRLAGFWGFPWVTRGVLFPDNLVPMLMGLTAAVCSSGITFNPLKHPGCRIRAPNA